MKYDYLRPLALIALMPPVAAQGVPAPETVAFTGLAILDGTDAPPRVDAVLVVTGERIAGVYERSSWDPPEGARVVAADGLFAVPGLWDMHVHLRCTDAASLPLYPALGVTGVRDMGGDFEQIDGWRRSIESGDGIGPRILTSGPMLESTANEAAAAGREWVEDRSKSRIAVGSPDEARAAVARLAAMGVDFVKLRTLHDEPTYLALAAAARAHDLALVGHPPWELDPLVAIEAGQKSFEHGFYPWPLEDYAEDARKALFAGLIDKRVALVPTLIAWESRMTGMPRIEAIAGDALGELDRRRRFLQPKHVALWREKIDADRDTWPTETSGWRDTLDRHAREIGDFHRAGVTVLPGSDVCGLMLFPGFSLHDELALFVDRVGMSPREALRSATRDATEFLGMGAELGTLEPGKLADIVLLGSDPTVSIRNIADVRGVVLRGRYLDAEQLGAITEGVARSAGGK